MWGGSGGSSEGGGAGRGLRWPGGAAWRRRCGGRRPELPNPKRRGGSAGCGKCHALIRVQTEQQASRGWSGCAPEVERAGALDSRSNLQHVVQWLRNRFEGQKSSRRRISPAAALGRQARRRRANSTCQQRQQSPSAASCYRRSAAAEVAEDRKYQQSAQKQSDRSGNTTACKANTLKALQSRA